MTNKRRVCAVLLIVFLGAWRLQSIPTIPGNGRASNTKTFINAKPPGITGDTGIIIEPEMVLVQGGRFAMGSNDNSNQKPIHTVRLSSFKIAKYETTMALWQSVMGTNPIGREGCLDCPLTSVSWEHIQTFIKKLNGLSGKNYRLPTEAEWEYAARGGKKGRKFEYAGSNDIDAVAWNLENSGSNAHPVGQKEANELGVYDMSGNVFEWCYDWYAEDYYGKSPRNDPKGPASGPYHVVRGGNWVSEPANCRITYRIPHRLGHGGIGFRLASSL